MKTLFILFTVLSIFSCKNVNNEELSFILLEDFTLDGESVFDDHTVNYYGEFYIVKDFHPSDSNISKLDSFACERYKARTKDYHTLIITFYKHSKRTNVEELTKYERELARYSDMHDKLYEYKILSSRDRPYKVRYKMHKRSIIEKSEFECDG